MTVTMPGLFVLIVIAAVCGAIGRAIGSKDGAPFRKDNLPDSQVPRGASRSPSGATETDAEAVATNEGMPPREPDQTRAGVKSPCDH